MKKADHMRESPDNILMKCSKHSPKPINYSGDLMDLIDRCVKKCFVDGDKKEHMWVKVTGVIEEELEGILDNMPVSVSTPTYGDRVRVKREEIEAII